MKALIILAMVVLPLVVQAIDEVTISSGSTYTIEAHSPTVIKCGERQSICVLDFAGKSVFLDKDGETIKQFVGDGVYDSVSDAKKAAILAGEKLEAQNVCIFVN